MVGDVVNYEEKNLIIKIQNVIDTILENQNILAFDRDLMYKLNDDFKSIDQSIDNFSVSYLNFLSEFNPFFEMLIEKLKEYESDLLEEKILSDEYIFEFNFTEFYEKENLKTYSEMIDVIKQMFGENSLLQGIFFYLHINSLLRRYMFCDNKIKLIDGIPTIEIGYSSRVSYYKEEYITNFRHELEEGVRTGVFLDDEEIISYVKEEIKELEYELNS